jgi:hypothetical protein
VLQRLMTFPIVLVTGHQGFFTTEAMRDIAATTFDNLACFRMGTPCATWCRGPRQGAATCRASEYAQSRNRRRGLRYTGDDQP